MPVPRANITNKGEKPVQGLGEGESKEYLLVSEKDKNTKGNFLLVWVALIYKLFFL